MALVSLAREQWLELRNEHRAAVALRVEPHLTRRTQGIQHPIDDFLWDYYPFSPGRFSLWNPGVNLRLLDYRHDDGELPNGWQLNADGSAGFAANRLPEKTQQRLTQELTWVSRLLQGTTERKPGFGCFGLHEWAMVLGQADEERRHANWPMRVTGEKVRQTIHDIGLRCTHFDAWRFFTDEALPLNPLQHSRASQPDNDQAGCLHANMDLYKWCMRLQPLVPSTLVVQCFDLSVRIRQLDMASSPYDFEALGIEPIRVETSEGRAQFAQAQREFSISANTLRTVLLHEMSEVLCLFPSLDGTLTL